jgi:hypothetical protein
MRPLLMVALCACNTLPDPTLDVLDTVSTVARATWTEDDDEPTRIEVSRGEHLFLVSDWQQPAEEHHAELLGLWPNEEWSARVVSESGKASADIPFATGGLPADLPTLEVTGHAGFDGYLSTSILGANVYSVVLDETGRIVWYAPAASPFAVLTSRLRLDGGGILRARSYESDIGGPPELDWLDWGGEADRTVSVQNYTHAFVEASGGELYVLQNDIRDTQEWGYVWGSDLARLDTDDSVTPIWSTWDIWTPSDVGVVEDNGYWTHANALDLSADESRVTMGMRELSQIVGIDLESGTVDWFLSGAEGYRFPNPEDAPHEQHQFQWLDDHLLVFDNREADQGSRAVELSFDDSARTASATWSWTHPGLLWSYVLGDVDRLDDGGTLVTFATAGTIDDVGPDDDLRWEVATRFRTVFGFVQRVDALPGVERVR